MAVFVKSEVSETTQLLLDWAEGDDAALERLTPHIYQKMRRMAAGLIRREREGQTLPTALVHEAHFEADRRRESGRDGQGVFLGCVRGLKGTSLYA